MAQKVQVTLLCDLDDGNVDAAETLQFSLGNTAYEIDVCAKHAQQIRDGLGPFVDHGRRVSGNARRTQHVVADRRQIADIRSWAKGRGIHVDDRGRIPASVVREYRAAH